MPSLSGPANHALSGYLGNRRLDESHHVQLPWAQRGRDYGSSVMYSPWQILIAGGSQPPTNTAEILNIADRDSDMAVYQPHGVSPTTLEPGAVAGRHVLRLAAPAAMDSTIRETRLRRGIVEYTHQTVDDDGESDGGTLLPLDRCPVAVTDEDPQWAGILPINRRFIRHRTSSRDRGRPLPPRPPVSRILCHSS